MKTSTLVEGNSIKAGKQTISPGMASGLLSRNKVNRPISIKLVQKITNDMRGGRYMYTGQPIVFDWDGNLIDGQHRLSALLECNKPFEFNIVTGVDPKAQDVFDCGKTRTLADNLHIKYQITDANTVASAYRMLTIFRKTSGEYIHKNTPEFPAPSMLECLETFQKEPGLLDGRELGRRINSELKQGRAIWMVMHYLTGKVDRDAADAFFDGLETGADLDKKSPIRAFRSQLIRFVVAGKTLGIQEVAWRLVRAWDAWRDDKPLEKIAIMKRSNLSLPALE